ncbi:UNVERIFIED_CONTAM: hypothetical protein Cloal_0351 [Acetivibrio alkalicellulosi]
MSDLFEQISKKVEGREELSRSRFERLMLITEGLWEIMKKEHNYSDEKLVEMIREIDLKDGIRDGRVLLPPIKCDACNKTIDKGSNKCIYCGNIIDMDIFYR